MSTKKTAATVEQLDPAQEAFEKAVAAGHRLPESEAIILGSKNGDLMYRYVETVLKGPWPEAEPWIAELGADTVISYIQCYRGSRWRRAEQTILARRHPQDLYSYALVVLQSPWPAAEPLLLQSNNSEWIIAYAHNVRLGHWPAGEDWVIAHGLAESWARLLVWDNVLDARLARKCTCWRFLFAKYVIDGMLPNGLHRLMLADAIKNPNDPWVKKYFRFKKYQRPPRKPRSLTYKKPPTKL